MKKIWNDPVGSKVIAGIILAILTLVYTFITSWYQNIDFKNAFLNFWRYKAELWVYILVTFGLVALRYLYFYLRSPNKKLGDFFTKKSDEKKLIQKADKEILILQETGRLIAETCRQEILAFLRKGGKVRLIVVSDAEEIVKLMALRNANLSTSELMKDRMDSGIDMLKVLAREAKELSRNVEVRFLPYPIDITAVYKDPYAEKVIQREALIRLQGYKVTFDDKLDFFLNATTTKSTFDTYLQQVERMWVDSSKCILLTGKPRVGKSTIIKKVVSTLKLSHLKVYGFMTLDFRDGLGERIGFDVMTIDESKKDKLAIRHSDGTYDINNQVIEDIIVSELSKDQHDNDLVIIDEIGPIQLSHANFHKTIENILENRNVSILGVIAEAKSPALDAIRNNMRIKIIEVREDNRDLVFENILSEFSIEI